MSNVGKYFSKDGYIIKIVNRYQDYAKCKIIKTPNYMVSQNYYNLEYTFILEDWEEMPEYGTPLYKAMYEKI